MRVDLNDMNPGVFFSWPNNKKDDEGGITLRILPNEMIDEINDLATEKKKKFRGGTAYDDIKVNKELIDELTWDYCIVKWSDLQDKNGEEIPCTKENKLIMINKHVKFSLFVAECLEKLQEFEKEEEEKEEKNS